MDVIPNDAIDGSAGTSGAGSDTASADAAAIATALALEKDLKDLLDCVRTFVTRVMEASSGDE